MSWGQLFAQQSHPGRGQDLALLPGPAPRCMYHQGSTLIPGHPNQAPKWPAQGCLSRWGVVVMVIQPHFTQGPALRVAQEPSELL